LSERGVVVLDKALVEEAKGIFAASMLERLNELTRGLPCPSCSGEDGFARLTEGEVKEMTKAAVSKVFKLLWLRENAPESYQPDLRGARMHVGDEL
jgi:hypothetical protein